MEIVWLMFQNIFVSVHFSYYITFVLNSYFIVILVYLCNAVLVGAGNSRGGGGDCTCCPHPIVRKYKSAGVIVIFFCFVPILFYWYWCESCDKSSCSLERKEIYNRRADAKDFALFKKHVFLCCFLLRG